MLFLCFSLFWRYSMHLVIHMNFFVTCFLIVISFFHYDLKDNILRMQILAEHQLVDSTDAFGVNTKQTRTFRDLRS